MRGEGQKLALLVQRPLHGGDQVVDRRRELVNLVAARGHRHAVAVILARNDVGRPARQRANRRERPSDDEVETTGEQAHHQYAGEQQRGAHR